MGNTLHAIYLEPSRIPSIVDVPLVFPASLPRSTSTNSSDMVLLGLT
jgi:hypothetical protein